MSPWPVALGVLTAVLIVVAAVAVPNGAPPQRSAAPTTSIATATRTASPTDTTGAAVGSPPVTPSTTPLPVIGTDVGQLAPDSDLPTPEGRRIALADFRGQSVWINFWAPWCLACRTEMPRLEGFHLDRRDDGLVILGVGVRDSPEGMREYADDVGVSYPIVVDGDGQVASRYGALALPVHFWIDRGGIVRDWAFGGLPPDLLRVSLESIL